MRFRQESPAGYPRFETLAMLCNRMDSEGWDLVHVWTETTTEDRRDEYGREKPPGVTTRCFGLFKVRA